MVTLFGLAINTWAVIVIIALLLIILLMARAQRDPESDFDWVDLFTDVDQATGKVKASLSKILQIIGGITGTFIVIKLALTGLISFDIFAAYLAYVASIEGFSKFMIARYGAGSDRSDGDRYYRRPYHQYGRDDYTPPPKPPEE